MRGMARQVRMRGVGGRERLRGIKGVVIELLLGQSTGWPLEVLAGEEGRGAERGGAEVAVGMIGSQTSHGRDWREGGSDRSWGEERRLHWPGPWGYKVTSCK